MSEAEDISMFDRDSIGVAKGRPGGYCAIWPANADINKLKDVKKTLKDLLKEVEGGASGGYISEDGVEFSTDTDSDEHSDWAGDTIDGDLTSYAESVKVTFLESTPPVLKAVYGDDNVTVDGATITVVHNKNFTAPRVYVFDSVVSATKVERNIVPLGRIFERDSVTLNSSDLKGFSPTIKCMPFDDDGNTKITVIYDVAKAAKLEPAAASEEGKPVQADAPGDQASA